MGVKALFLMYGGKLTLKKAYMVNGAYDGEEIDAPILMALVVCDEGNVLFDTGLHSGGIEDPLNTWGDRAITLFSPDMKQDYDISEILKGIGFTVGDIDIVINSHLHFDHVGGNRRFTDSKIMVQKAEYRFACFPDSYTTFSYPKSHFDHPSLHYELLEGDKKIFDGVYVVSTSGHTPGHQSLVVNLKNTGTMVLAGDAIPLRINFEQDILPGGVWSAEAAYHSILRLKRIVEVSSGQIVFPHDAELIPEYKMAPDFYD